MPITLPSPSEFVIAPSILSADFASLGREVSDVLSAGADWVHVDVMDGHFVPNITIGLPVVAALRKITEAPLDVHLMIETPERYIDGFAEAGADIISVHVEASIHLHRTLQAIRKLGVRSGVTLNPHTPPEDIEWVLEEADLILVMSVNPGFGGQSFIDSSLRKIQWLRDRCESLGLSTTIEVDGGVGPQNIRSIRDAGANAFVAGNAIFSHSDYSAPIAAMRAALQ